MKGLIPAIAVSRDSFPDGGADTVGITLSLPLSVKVGWQSRLPHHSVVYNDTGGEEEEGEPGTEGGGAAKNQYSSISLGR